MNKNINKNKEAHQLTFKRSHFVLLMCIALIAILAFTMVNMQFASAGTTTGDRVFFPPPIEQRNLSEEGLCSECHNWIFPPEKIPRINVTVWEEKETDTHRTYNVTGDDNGWPGREGWGVFDEFGNEEFDGLFSGSFTLPKESVEKKYIVYWVDSYNETDGLGSSNSKEIWVPEGANTAPSIPDITGETNGKVGTPYSYSFVSTDDEEDDITYFIDWGDGSTTEWPEYLPSGTPYSESHSWSEPGDYIIKARARDRPGLESDNETLDVNITIQTVEPKLKIRLKMIGIGKVRATIENTGSGDLSDIKWNITANGGIFRLFKRIDVNANGTIETLAKGGKTEIGTKDKSIILRFCIAKVTVTAIVGEEEFTHEQLVVVIGRLIFARPILLFQP